MGGLPVPGRELIRERFGSHAINRASEVTISNSRVAGFNHPQRFGQTPNLQQKKHQK